MPPSSSRRVPRYRRHKPSGLALVELNGHRHYLGPYGSPESRRRYAELIAEWEASGRQPLHKPGDLTIGELIDRYWHHAEWYYRRPDGSPSGELACLRQALRPLRALYGDAPARDFGPRGLLAIRHAMIDKRWCRRSVNQQVNRLRRIFKWATEQELLPATVLPALQAVEGLRRGRCSAPESKPVHGVPRAYIDAIEPHVSAQVWALVQLQLLTAARAGELVIARPIDLDTSGRIWLYAPAEHKTAHHGHRRRIYLGPPGPGGIDAVPQPGPRCIPLLAGRSRSGPPRRGARSPTDAGALRQPAGLESRAPAGVAPRAALHRRFLPPGDPARHRSGERRGARAGRGGEPQGADSS